MKKLLVMVLLAFAFLALMACGANNDIATPDVNGIEPDLPYQATPQADDLEVTEQPFDGSDGILHQFPNLGFSVVFPASWEGKYGLGEYHLNNEYSTETTFIHVYHIATREELGTGWLWTFRRIHEDNFVADGEPIPHNHVIMYQGGEYAFIMHMPSDVQWDYEAPDGELATEYLEMADQWEEIANSFRLMD